MLRRLWSHPKSLIATVTLLAAMLGLVPIATKTLLESSEQVRMDITDHARGNYDILVRPENTRTSVEKKLGVVEENYLGVGDGGISLDIWEDIANDKRIEFAAPVASLGFFTKIDQTFQLPEPDGPTRYHVVHETNDGHKTYQATEPEKAYLLFSYFGDQRDSFYSSSLVNIFNLDSKHPNFEIPSSYHPVVAIDPEAESSLTGIDFDALNHEVDDEELWPPEATYVPLIDIVDSPTPIKTSIIVETLNVSKEDIEELKSDVDIAKDQPLDDIIFLNDEENRIHVETYLNNLSVESMQTYTLDFSKYLSPFEKQWYMLDNKYQVIMEEDYNISTHGPAGRLSGYQTQNIFYQVSSPLYEWDGDKLSVPLVDWNGNIPIHRHVKAVEQNQSDSDNGYLFYLHPVDKMKMEEAEETLAASPLGIYQYHYGIHEETGAELKPTHLPGNYLPIPAQGLISIDWAERYKGNAPIDAIRVKVAGIDGYTKEAAELIKRVAGDIENKGLQVDIIAGSSHKTMSINVEEIGTVAQPWTTLGAADTILDSWNIFAVTIGGTFIIVVLLSLIARLQAMEREQAVERQRLAEIGWLETTIKQFFRRQWILQLIAAIVLSGISLLITFGIQPLLFVGYICTLFAVLLLKTLISFFNGRLSERSDYRPQRSLIITNIRYYLTHIVAVSFQLFLSSGLLAFIIIVSNIADERMRETNLGTYIHWQSNNQQLLLLIGISILTIFTLVESLYRLWQVRKDHIKLLAEIGWHNKQIRRMFRCETFFWSGISVIGGMGVGIVLSLLATDFAPNILWHSLSVAGVVVLIVLIVTEWTSSTTLKSLWKG